MSMKSVIKHSRWGELVAVTCAGCGEPDSITYRSLRSIERT